MKIPARLHTSAFVFLIALFISAYALPGLAQQGERRVFTADDYARAERFMPYKTAPLVLHSGIRANWLPGDRFWYRNTTGDGFEFVLYDAASGKRQPAFDQAKVAAALSTALNAKVEANRRPFTDFEYTPHAKGITFAARGRRFQCDLQQYQCAPDSTPRTGSERRAAAPGAPPLRNDITSPDNKLTAFIRDWNLWVRDLGTGKETQLTTDGVKDYGYATDNAGWIKSDRPILMWSPDSKNIATFRQDQRNVGEMYLVETGVGHPKLEAWKYPLPGDETVTMIERVVINLDGPKIVRFQMPPDQHRSTLCDHIICRGSDWADIEWSPDSAKLAFVSTSRDHKDEHLRVADAATGAIRDVMEEKVDTFYESGAGRVN